MSMARDIFTIFAVSAGGFFFLAGTVGLLRFPDTLTRLHALTKADNVGLGCLAFGLVVDWSFEPQATAQLLLAWVLVLVSSSLAALALAQHAVDLGVTPWRRP